METKKQAERQIEQIKAGLNALENGELLNHPSLVKIWEGIREIEKFVGELK